VALRSKPAIPRQSDRPAAGSKQLAPRSRGGAKADRAAHRGGGEGAVHRTPRLRISSIDLSQCHNESVDLVRLIISLHPQYLVELKPRVRNFGGTSSCDPVVGPGAAPVETASMLWVGRAAARSLDHFARLLGPRLGHVQTNYFPAVDDMCAKSYLARKLKFYARLFPQQYDFSPRTWILPQELEQLRAEVAASHAASTAAAAAIAATSTAATPASPTGAPTPPASLPTYIFKPSSGSQGAGIQLAQTLRDVDRIVKAAAESGTNLIAQDYIGTSLGAGSL